MMLLFFVKTLGVNLVFATVASENTDILQADSVRNTGLIIVPSARDRCQLQGNFYCERSGQCISANGLCDGINDCSSLEDEVSCAPASSTNIINASCGSTVYGSGTLRIPSYSETNVHHLGCNWTLVANPPSESVIITIPSMNLDSCCTSLSLFNKSHALSRRLSGNVESYLHILDGLAVVSFTTNRTSSASGLSIKFSTIPRWGMKAGSPPCGSTLYEFGYVQSPNYPSNYSHLLNCKWTLIASPTYGKITLQILSFNTESCCDFVSIYTGNTLLHRLSGKFAPFTLLLEDTAVISFTTDGKSAAPGFSMWFSTSVTTIDMSVAGCKRRGYFYCAISNQCIEPRHRCDGYSHCYSGEDEVGCDTSSTTRSDYSLATRSDYSLACLLAGYTLVRINFR